MNIKEAAGDEQIACPPPVPGKADIFPCRCTNLSKKYVRNRNVVKFDRVDYFILIGDALVKGQRMANTLVEKFNFKLSSILSQQGNSFFFVHLMSVKLEILIYIRTYNTHSS